MGIKHVEDITRKFKRPSVQNREAEVVDIGVLGLENPCSFIIRSTNKWLCDQAISE